MTDQELLELVQNTSAADLELDQIRLLQQRLDESPELQQVFRSRLKLQTYLVEAVSRLEPLESDLEGMAEATSRGGGTATRFVCFSLACLALATVAVGFMAWSASFVSSRDRRAEDTEPPPRKTAAKRAPTRVRVGAEAADVARQQVEQSGAAAAGDQPAHTPAAPEVRPRGLPSAGSNTGTGRWGEFAAAGVPKPFAAVCFDLFDIRQSLPRREDLQEWFAPVPGAAHQITETVTGAGTCAAIHGTFRLRAPWTEDSVLRFSLAGGRDLRIHCFRGGRGVTLVEHSSAGRRWAAYITRRAHAASEPFSWALTATDGGRAARTGLRLGGPLALRYRRGEMILSRGDVVLLRAPLPGPPQEVFFDGSAVFQGISISRTHGIPAAAARLSTVQHFERPGKQFDWSWPSASGARVEALAGGELRCELVDAATPLWVHTPRADWQAAILELADATPGVEIRFSDRVGSRLGALRYLTDPVTGQLQLVADERDGAEQALSAARFVRPVAQQHRLRLVFGIDSVRWWLSVDGQHWAEGAPPINVSPSDITHWGLHLAPSVEKCGVTLRSVVRMEMPRLTALAPADWLQQARAVDAADYDSWLQVTIHSRPEGCELGSWQTASALATLARGCRRRLAIRLLARLLDDARRRLSLEQQRDLLGEAALLVDGGSNPRLLEQLMARYRTLAWAAFDRDRSRPFSFVRRALMTAPWAPNDLVPVADRDLIRTELLQLVYAGRWRETLDFCRMLRFFHFEDQAPLFEWSAALASRDAATRFGAGMVRRQRQSWRELCVPEVDQQAYTQATEMQALLKSGAFDEASGSIAALSPRAVRGVTPDFDDPQLWVSLPTVVRQALQDYPLLRQQIVQQASGAAELRVQQGIAEQDVDVLRLATLQFQGTSGAARAHRWLGDRALAGGWFAQAALHYRQAVVPGSEAARQDTADRFAYALEAMHRQRPGAPPPDAYDVQLRQPLSAPAGRSIHHDAADPSGFGVDSISRQLAVVVSGDMMFVNNRFRLAALSAHSGQIKWLGPQLPSQAGGQQDWLPAPMRPLVSFNRVFVRQQDGDRPALICLDRASGQPQWIAKQREGVSLVSDPFVQGHQLCCLTLVGAEQDQWQLRCTWLDPETGAVWRERDLITLRDHWHARRVCQVSTRADSFLVTLGGISLCCETSGDTRWLRSHLVVPAESEPGWIKQTFQPPLVYDDGVFLAQPGVRTVACVQADTGRLRWRRLIPGIRAIVGVAEDLVILHTDRRLTALHAVTGETQWRHDVDSIHYVQPWHGSEWLLYVVSVRTGGKSAPQLVWINAQSGQFVRSADLARLAAADPRLGPLFVCQDEGRVWAFFGRGRTDPARQLVELVPLGQTE